METEVKAAIVGAVISALITGTFSFFIGERKMDNEKKAIVSTLQEHFDSVDNEMDLNQAIKKIYEDSQNIKNENESLRAENESLRTEIGGMQRQAKTDKTSDTVIISDSKYMTDVVPAYQSGGNEYKEYTASNSGGTEYFSMGGVKYTYGMTFDADINVFNDVSWAVYNLDNKYRSLEFVVCHVDGTDIGETNKMDIFYDGTLTEQIDLAPDMAPKNITLDITGVNQLKIQLYPSGISNPVYGIGNPVIK